MNSEGRSSSFFGTKIAYRSWKVSGMELPTNEINPETGVAKIKWTLCLGAVALSQHKWPPYEKMVSNCSHGTLFSSKCTCGIYAYKSMRGLPDYVRSISRDNISLDGNNDLSPVIGEVELWGKCLEHTLGWRAEFAYPKRLYCPEEASINYEGLVYRLAANYGIEVHSLSLKEMKKMVFGDEK